MIPKQPLPGFLPSGGEKSRFLDSYAAVDLGKTPRPVAASGRLFPALAVETLLFQYAVSGAPDQTFPPRGNAPVARRLAVLVWRAAGILPVRQ